MELDKIKQLNLELDMDQDYQDFIAKQDQEVIEQDQHDRYWNKGDQSKCKQILLF